MRFLDTQTGQFVKRDPAGTVYAILSHTWREREQTYDELGMVQARYRDLSRSGYISRPSSPSSHFPHSDPNPTQTGSAIWDDVELSRKIRDACKVARDTGYRYLWIDSCCIDKTSSAELSEAINSMYEWCSLSEGLLRSPCRCPPDRNPREDVSAFRESR